MLFSSGESEDGLQGRVNPDEPKYVGKGDETNVMIHGLRVPDDATPGQMLRYTIRATTKGMKQQGSKKTLRER